MRFTGGVARLALMVSAWLGIAGGVIAQSSDTLRVMQYNLTNYGNYTTYCTAQNNTLGTKDANLKQTIAYFQPHIFGVNEIGSNALLKDRIKTLVLNQDGRTWYDGVLGNNVNGSDIVNAFFWDTRKVGLASQRSVPAPTRDLDIFKIYYKPIQGTDTLFMHVIVGHLKAGNTPSDATGRANMISAMRTWMNSNLPNPGRAIFMGDLNAYTSSEACYQALVNPSSGTPFRDPINRPGSWSSNRSFADIHTQSTRVSSNGCLSGGGLDDRFDQILMTDALLQNSGSGQRIYYSSGSYKALGQDGNHYNQDVNSGTNRSVPSNVATALWNTSDHLPITAKLVVDGLTAAYVAYWPTTLQVDYAGNAQIRIMNSDAANPVTELELYSLDGRRQSAQSLAPISSQLVGMPTVAAQVLLVKINTARSTYTKRILVPRG